MERRDFLATLAALAALPRAAFSETTGLHLGDGLPFAADFVTDRARRLAAEPYAPRPTIPEGWRDLTYDEYRKIWFDGRNALWEGTGTGQRVDLFPPGLFFPQAVAIHVVEDGTARPILFSLDVFDRTDKFPADLPLDDTMGYSGLRLRAELEKKGIFQEYAVFQGASYFRGSGTGQTYGLSARGLALKTADPEGEEFPDFTHFWLERPDGGVETIVIHALLDSPSCTGSFRFEITPGPVLDMQVRAHIFAREELANVGIAPLTSMFLFDDTMRQRFSDFRPAVHDSDGLLIYNGAGEVLWRPLSNPVSLQISAFVDANPRGFGLMQRKREFSDYNDLEALYHQRPAAWITPGEDWGAGSVTLVEIPADLEIYDNIVAYWHPATAIPAGAEHRMTYALRWGAAPAPATPEIQVVNTALGGRPEGGRVVVIDFEDGASVPADLTAIDVVLRSSVETTTRGDLQRNPETNGPRLAFTFEPEDAPTAEFRVQLRLGTAPLSEVWIYRWTAE